MTKSLTVVADDFAKDQSSDLAILHCHNKGIVTATSVFATSPRLFDALKCLRENPQLKVGLHFDLSFAKPLTKAVLDLTEQFSDIHQLLKNLTRKHVYEECKAQLELLSQHVDHLTHIDIHRLELYFYEDLYKGVIDLASEKHLRLRQPFGKDQQQWLDLLSSHYKIDRDLILSQGHRFRQLYSQANILSFDHFYLMNPWRADQKGFFKFLASLPQGHSELCCHPSLINNCREEANLLCHQETQRLVTEHRIKLV